MTGDAFQYDDIRHRLVSMTLSTVVEIGNQQVGTGIRLICLVTRQTGFIPRPVALSEVAFMIETG